MSPEAISIHVEREVAVAAMALGGATAIPPDKDCILAGAGADINVRVCGLRDSAAADLMLLS